MASLFRKAEPYGVLDKPSATDGPISRWRQYHRRRLALGILNLMRRDVGKGWTVSEIRRELGCHPRAIIRLMPQLERNQWVKGRQGNQVQRHYHDELPLWRFYRLTSQGLRALRDAG